LPGEKAYTPLGFENIPRLKFKKIDLAQGIESLRKLAENLTSRFASPPAKTEAEDYEKIASAFLPDGASFVTPKFPADSKSIAMADFDRDSVNELIGTYSHDGRLHTMILKKAGTRWVRVSEIHHNDRGELNYRGFTDLANDGRLHMLVGVSNKEKSNLYGYTLWNGNVDEIFVRPYHKFEIIKPGAKSSQNSPVRLATWEKDEDGVYDVKMHHYNNDRLEETAVPPWYWKNRILYDYAMQVKKSPYSVDGWYTLARALIKAGLNNDAATAVETGSRLDKDGTYSHKFNQLKKMF
jgi:hypothetical protein